MSVRVGYRSNAGPAGRGPGACPTGPQAPHDASALPCQCEDHQDRLSVRGTGDFHGTVLTVTSAPRRHLRVHGLARRHHQYPRDCDVQVTALRARRHLRVHAV